MSPQARNAHSANLTPIAEHALLAHTSTPPSIGVLYSSVQETKIVQSYSSGPLPRHQSSNSSANSASKSLGGMVPSSPSGETEALVTGLIT